MIVCVCVCVGVCVCVSICEGVRVFMLKRVRLCECKCVSVCVVKRKQNSDISNTNKALPSEMKYAKLSANNNFI